MSVKGTIAKDNIIKKLQQAFGKDWIGEYSKKYYVWADDGGERVQIAISMTCPKIPVGGAQSPTSDRMDFAAAPEKVEMEITPEEQANIDRLKKLLDL